MRIFSCHHAAPARFINTALFQTFPLIGEGDVTADPSLGRIGDNRLSEMRHHWYVWQRYRSGETVGFEHYRRLFLVTGPDGAAIARRYPDVGEMLRLSATYGTHHFYVNNAVFGQYLDYREAMDEREIAAVVSHLESYDIVTVRPENRDLREMLFFPWERFVEYARATRFVAAAPELELTVPHQCYWLNCYIMKRPIFDEYMDFAFQALDHFEEGMRDEKPAARFFGHMTERLFSVFLQRKRIMSPHLRVLELPTMWVHADLDPQGATISHDWRHDISVAEQRGRAQAS